MKADFAVHHFVDEIDAMVEERQFAMTVDRGGAPFTCEVHVHLGEGGATTVFYQGAQMVGIVNRFRDAMNRTCLVCVDLR